MDDSVSSEARNGITVGGEGKMELLSYQHSLNCLPTAYIFTGSKKD